MWNETQTALSGIETQSVDYISFDDNCCTKHAFEKNMEHVKNLYVSRAKGPCKSSLKHSNTQAVLTKLVHILYRMYY